MPDRGMLDQATITANPVAPGGVDWTLPGARWAQITFEVSQQAALGRMPGDVNRPIPCYGRLFVLDAPEGPAGPFRLASLMAGGRYRMLPKNVIADAVVDGPHEQVAAAFGSPSRPGSISFERSGPDAAIEVADADGVLARLRIGGLYAVDPAMLRWDGWLGFAEVEGTRQLVEHGPRPRPTEAFLSKRGELETPAELPRSHPWRMFRSLGTISTCYEEGELVLAAPEPQQPLL